jgi:hypothetical protein
MAPHPGKWRRSFALGDQFFGGTPAGFLAQPLEDDVEHRDHEHAHHGRGQHAVEDRRADFAPAGSPRPGRDHRRQQPEDEGEARHHHRPEAKPRALDSGTSSDLPAAR